MNWKVVRDGMGTATRTLRDVIRYSGRGSGKALLESYRDDRLRARTIVESVGAVLGIQTQPFSQRDKRNLAMLYASFTFTSLLLISCFGQVLCQETSGCPSKGWCSSNKVFPAKSAVACRWACCVVCLKSVDDISVLLFFWDAWIGYLLLSCGLGLGF